METKTKIPLAPMGVLAPVSAHAGHSAQPPIDTSGNFPARGSAESISPNQNIAQWGVKGGISFFLIVPNLFFGSFMSPCKKLKSYHTPLCQFSNGGNKKKRRKIPKIVAYGCFDETVCTAPLGPK